MKKILKYMTVILMTLSLTGCAAFVAVHQAMTGIEPGMTTGQIRKMLGNPDLRRFEDRYEEWEYHENVTQSSYNVYIVKFTDGKVSAMDSYRVDRPLLPERPDMPARPHDGMHPGANVRTNGD